MNKLWIDIEEYFNCKYHLGYLIIDKQKNEIRGYEKIIGADDNIDDIILNNNISEIYIFNENDSLYLKNKLFKNTNCKIINVSEKYTNLLEGTKLQLTKNMDIAKASGININYDRLHNPLYDVQLSYCTYHNFKISSVDLQQDMLYDSFFALTGKFNILWSLMKTKDINLKNVDLRIIQPKKLEKRYFLDASMIMQNEVTLIDYDTNEKIVYNLTRNNIPKFVEAMQENIIIFLEAKDQKELSFRIWTIMYEDNKRSYNHNNFITPLFVFLGINLARFKIRLKELYTIEYIKDFLENELSIENIKRINSYNDGTKHLSNQ